MTTKICKKCQQIIPPEMKRCYSCQKQTSADWKKRNKERVSEYNKKYKEENREEISEYNKMYNIENREKIQKRSSKNYLKFYHENINFKIAHCLRRRYKKFLLDDKGKNKSKSALNILGCSIDFLKLWFSFCFEKDMTFENHGKLWHIDHMIPCSKFNLQNDNEKLKCFHWTNMKPMYAIDNMKKNNKISTIEIEKHEENLLTFLQSLNDEYKEEYTIIDIDRFQYFNNQFITKGDVETSTGEWETNSVW